MGAQLALFEWWQTTVPEPAAIPDQPVAVDAGDPRQTDLFDGPYRERHEAAMACRRLDGAALRRAHASDARRYPQWETAQAWTRWADGLDWLSAGDPDERAARALSLDASGSQRFPGMPEELLTLLRREALVRAARDGIETRGPTALVDGRPAGWLLLSAGLPDDAAQALRAAAEVASLDAGIHWLLGVAHDRAGRPGEALAAWCHACLLDPSSLDERELSPVAEDLLDLAADLEGLPGEPREWLPALADLRGAASLPAWVNDLPIAGSAAGRFAVLLRSYRDAQSAQAPDERRRELKRAMIAIAPAARELVRRI